MYIYIHTLILILKYLNGIVLLSFNLRMDLILLAINYFYVVVILKES